MDLKEIKQIIELMKKNGLSYFHLETEGMKIKLRKGVDFDTLQDQLASLSLSPSPAYAPAPNPGPSFAPPHGPGSSPAQPAEDGSPPAGEIAITSPMVGTFYRSQDPDSPPFVEKGAKVDESSTVCIIEAMKVMNEIKAEIKGTVTQVLVENGQPVQYGEPMFHVRPD